MSDVKSSLSRLLYWLSCISRSQLALVLQRHKPTIMIAVSFYGVTNYMMSRFANINLVLEYNTEIVFISNIY